MKRLTLKTYPREAQLFHLESAASWQRVLMVTKHKVIRFSYPVELAALELWVMVCTYLRNYHVTSQHVRTMLSHSIVAPRYM